MRYFLPFLLTVLLLISNPSAGIAQEPTPEEKQESTPTPSVCHQIKDALRASWDAYKLTYMEPDGRVRDPNANDISTSESQSYAMLRAVWMRDQDTFDKVYQWAVDNLITPNKGHLGAWKWGKHEDGEWKILDPASASDADEDMALALLMAFEAFQEPRYKEEAFKLLHAIWDKEVVKTPYGQTLTPGDWVKQYKHAQTQGHITLNPSYFSPLSYRIFSHYDKTHDWYKLLDSSYKLLGTLKDRTRTGLPPNWFQLNLDQGRRRTAIQLYTDPKDQRSDYGYDAIRVHWRIGLDDLLTGDKRAKAVLKNTNFLERYWHVRHILPSPLTIDGIERNLDEILYASNSIYGATLPHLSAQYPQIAQDILNRFILNRLNQGIWEPATDYYAQNWLWLGLLGYYAQTCTTVQPRSPKQPVCAKALLELSPF